MTVRAFTKHMPVKCLLGNYICFVTCGSEKNGNCRGSTVGIVTCICEQCKGTFWTPCVIYKMTKPYQYI